MSNSVASQAIHDIANMATRARRRDIQAVFVSRHGWTVQGGPFAGMIVPQRSCWGDGDTLPKLLGCYELELHQAIGSIVEARPALVVNVGAAEGYYAVGLARLLPDATVHAFDTADLATEICGEAARLNDVAERVVIAGACDTEHLQALLSGAPQPVLLCDCEGCERALIDPVQVPALADTTMIIECHDFVDPTITQTLIDRLGPTHDLKGIRETARDPNTSAFLRPLESLDRWIAVCEFRPCMMHWLVATPKTAI